VGVIHELGSAESGVVRRDRDDGAIFFLEQLPGVTHGSASYAVSLAFLMDVKTYRKMAENARKKAAREKDYKELLRMRANARARRTGASDCEEEV